MIEVDNIVKTYGGFKAVDHLSFTLEKGKIYGFLGPNGAGKSTTMNIMTGYIAADSGTVKIDGLDIVKDAEKAKAHIGYLPEIPPLYNDMTVGEYLLFVTELKKVPKKERRDQIAFVLSKTKLGDYKDRMIRNLSKGYRQRVGLACAMVGKPDVIILDEPTVGLDPTQIIEMQNLMREMKEDHIVILSSHILSQVSEVCDCILIISHGKLVAQGSEKELEERENQNHEINIKAIANKEMISKALQDVANPEMIEFAEDEKAGDVLRFKVKSGAVDKSIDIAKALANNKIPVVGFTSSHVTLEDIFLNLTSTTPGISEKDRLKRERRQQKEEEKQKKKEEKQRQKQEKKAEKNKPQSMEMISSTDTVNKMTETVNDNSNTSKETASNENKEENE